ncbi:MAG: hypothetical protein ACOC6F_02440 [bacterium]
MDTILTAVVTTLITATITGIATYVLYWPKVKTDLKRQYASRFNEKKWDVYSDVAAALSQLLTRPADDTTEPQIPRFTQLAGDLWLVGSDELFIAYNELLREVRALRDDEQRLVETVKKVPPIIIEMRKDLGNETTEITTRDLLTPFIADIDEHL